MPSNEFNELLNAGYSEAFLRTPLGSATGLRRAFLRGESGSRTCKNCGHLYALPRELPSPVLNSAGNDLRFMYFGVPQDRGYCSCKCEDTARTPPSGDLFGDLP